MKGFKPLEHNPERIKLSREHWMSVNCMDRELDARRDFCDWAEDFVEELMQGNNDNKHGEADKILYDVFVEMQNLYVSVKSSATQTTVRGCMASSKVKKDPLDKGIDMRKPDDLFTQVYINYLPHDRELCWYQTPISTFRQLRARFDNNEVEVDNQGRLTSDAHDLMFGEPILYKIIDLPEIDVELQKEIGKAVESIKRIQDIALLEKINDIIK